MQYASRVVTSGKYKIKTAPAPTGTVHTGNTEDGINQTFDRVIVSSSGTACP